MTDAEFDEEAYGYVVDGNPRGVIAEARRARAAEAKYRKALFIISRIVDQPSMSIAMNAEIEAAISYIEAALKDG